MKCAKLFIIVVALTINGKGNAQKGPGPIEYDDEIGLVKRFGQSEGSAGDKVSSRWKLNATRFDGKFMLILYFNGIKDYNDDDEILLPEEKNQQVKSLSALPKACTPAIAAAGCLSFIVVVCGIAIVILCVQKRTAQQLNNKLKASLSGYDNNIEASAGGSQPPSSENEQSASTSKDASYSVVLKKQVVDNILYEPLETTQQSKNQ